jgi:hypothetical protein
MSGIPFHLVLLRDATFFELKQQLGRMAVPGRLRAR